MALTTNHTGAKFKPIVCVFRYLFKKALLEDDIAHQEAMEKKEKKEKSMTLENVKWEQGSCVIIGGN